MKTKLLKLICFIIIGVILSFICCGKVDIPSPDDIKDHKEYVIVKDFGDFFYHDSRLAESCRPLGGGENDTHDCKGYHIWVRYNNFPPTLEDENDISKIDIKGMRAKIGFHTDIKWLELDLLTYFARERFNPGSPIPRPQPFCKLRKIKGNTVIWHISKDPPDYLKVAWITKDNLTVFVTLNDVNYLNKGGNEIIEAYLKKYPSRLKKDLINKAKTHNFAVLSVEKYLEKLKSGKRDRVWFLGIKEFTSHQIKIKPNSTLEEAINEWEKWWRANKNKSLWEWRLDAIKKAIDKLDETSLPLYSPLYLDLFWLVPQGKLPPYVVETKEELRQLKNEWEKFWQLNKDKPQEEWWRYFIEFYIDLLERIELTEKNKSQVGKYLSHLKNRMEAFAPREIWEPISINPMTAESLQRDIQRIKEWYQQNKEKVKLAIIHDDEYSVVFDEE